MNKMSVDLDINELRFLLFCLSLYKDLNSCPSIPDLYEGKKLPFVFLTLYNKLESCFKEVVPK